MQAIMADVFAHLEGFHKKPFKERLELVLPRQLKRLFPQLTKSLLSGGLENETANLMVENCIGRLSVPVGVGIYFLINGKQYMIPMCIEEPSVIAAASHAAKIISRGGGFEASSTPPVMIGQIQLLEVDASKVFYIIAGAKRGLIQKANFKYCPGMRERGGGVMDLRTKMLSPVVAVVEVLIDVCDSMGANNVNSVCERLAPDIVALVPGARVGLRILSNYCTERMVRVSFKVPLTNLKRKGIDGLLLANRIVEANDFAKNDPYRASTHNKGIMNGMDAVALATGQDWRAIEASAHTWASSTGKYQPLTNYWVAEESLHGCIELPMAVGTRGGVLNSNTVYHATHYILGNPTSRELAEIIAAVGLANNFAAISAMMTEGIQKGHMSLHARNVAISAGVPQELVPEVVEFMKLRREVSPQVAIDYLTAHKLHSTIRSRPHEFRSLSTLYLNIRETKPPFKMNLAFDNSGLPSMHLIITKDSKPQPGLQENIHINLLGGNKGYKWIASFFQLLENIKLQPELSRQIFDLRNKVKILGALLNIISYHFLRNWDFEYSSQALSLILENNEEGLTALLKRVENLPEFVNFGCNLLKELLRVMNYHIEDMSSNSVANSDLLSREIKQELQVILRSNVQAYQLMESTTVTFEEFHEVRRKQTCATLMYLCDYMCFASIEPAIIEQLKRVGLAVELYGSAARDLEKFQRKGYERQPNLYAFWLRKQLLEDSASARSHYSAQVKATFDQIQEGVTSKDYRSLLTVGAREIAKHYSISPKL